jgi:hypothetical protein
VKLGLAKSAQLEMHAVHLTKGTAFVMTTNWEKEFWLELP